MKGLTIFLSIILAALMGFCVFFYVGGTLEAQVSCISANAADYPDAYRSIQNVISSDAAPQVFSHDPLDNASNYTLLDVNLTLTNRGIFDAEWVHLELTGANGDVAVYSLSGEGSDIAARSTGQMNLKLITRAGAQAPRTISLQYYVYGISRTVNFQIQ